MVATLLPLLLAAAAIAAAVTAAARMASPAMTATRAGSLAIGAAWIALLATLDLAGPAAIRASLSGLPLREILIASLFVYAVGVRDDARAVPPAAKILAQALAATLVAGGGIQIDHVTIAGTTWPLGSLAIAATVVWMVAITTAFNQLAQLDALGTWLAAFATAVCLAIVVVRADVDTALVLAALLGALAGFLPFSAGAGLGSAGSLLTGFVLGVTGITGLQKSATALAVGALFLLFSLPLFDLLTRVLRLRAERERKRLAERP
jgi:UDP-GlcNAc:undecaprenyl-phosphate GlcNAc-1-phosphate transferase